MVLIIFTNLEIKLRLEIIRFTKWNRFFEIRDICFISYQDRFNQTKSKSKWRDQIIKRRQSIVKIIIKGFSNLIKTMLIRFNFIKECKSITNYNK